MASLLKLLKNRTVSIILILLVLFGVVLLATPPAIRHYAVGWLRDHGAPHAEIRSVYFNPFSGTLFVLGLKASDNLAIGKAGVDIDWWPFLRHEVYIKDIDIENATLGLTADKKARWKITGLNIPSYNNTGKSPSNSQSKPWLPVLRTATLKNIHIKLAGDGINADIPIRSLKLDHAFMKPGKSQTLNSEIQLGQTVISSHGYHLANDNLRFQGQLTIPYSGTQFSARKINVEAKNLSVKAKAERLALGIKGLLVSRVSANGTSSIKVGDIEAKTLQLNSNPETSPNSRAPLSLAAIRKISVRNLAVSKANQVGISSIEIQGTDLPSTKKQSLGNIGSITATDASIAPDSIQLAQLRFHALNLALEHQKGGMAILNQMQAALSHPPAKKAAPSKPAHTPKTTKPTIISIGLITVDKGSKISFRDGAVYPPFHANLKVKKLSVSSLDTSGKKTGSVDAAMQLGNQGQLTLKGSLNLSSNSTSKLAFAIKRLSMPALTGYVETDFGSSIKTGQMDLNSHINLRGDAIDAQNKLDIRNLLLASSPQSGKAAAQSLGMPLDTAVDMLRDDKGDISLNVPINGRLDDPKFGINDAINKALLSAMKTAALSYAALLLQPYGSILPAISLASKLMGNESKPRLTPITFAARTATLSPQAKDYVTKITGLLKKKPFRLQVCGVTSLFEMHPKSTEKPNKKAVSHAETDRMLSLAKARSATVIKALVSGGISADRVFDCRPTTDDKPNASGRVELILN